MNKATVVKKYGFAINTLKEETILDNFDNKNYDKQKLG